MGLLNKIVLMGTLGLVGCAPEQQLEHLLEGRITFKQEMDDDLGLYLITGNQDYLDKYYNNIRETK